MEFFWQKHPALLYGLAFLLGCGWGLNGSYLLIIPTITLLFAYSNFLRHAVALLILLTALLYVKWVYVLPEVGMENFSGKGLFTIESLSFKKTHFGTFWVYKGSFRQFENYRNIPIAISIPNKPESTRPLADHAYWIQGTLSCPSSFHYHFKWDGKSAWEAIEGTSSFAEMRYLAKKTVTDTIQKQMSNPRSGNLLAGLATGDFDDTYMQYQLGRFGLQHIMAISGFHFSILAAFFSFALQLFFERKWSSALLILLLSSYFLFLGTAPSILRAWSSTFILMTGFLLEKKGSGLNSLGVGLLATLAYNPLYCLSLGFQFSFAATAAIFLLYPLAEQLLSYLFNKRPLRRALEMPLPDQHGFIVVTWLKQGLALTLAVNLVALPMMLYYFNKFPYMSLFYNLFFPFLISLSMLLLLLGFLFPPLHALNNWFSSHVLDLTYNMPTGYDWTLFVTDFPAWAVIAHVTVIFGAAIFWQYSPLTENLRDPQNVLFDGGHSSVG